MVQISLLLLRMFLRSGLAMSSVISCVKLMNYSLVILMRTVAMSL